MIELIKTDTDIEMKKSYDIYCPHCNSNYKKEMSKDELEKEKCKFCGFTNYLDIEEIVK
jgi:transposase-like protein